MRAPDLHDTDAGEPHYATRVRRSLNRPRARALPRLAAVRAAHAAFSASAIHAVTEAGAGMRPELTSFSLTTSPGVERTL